MHALLWVLSSFCTYVAELGLCIRGGHLSWILVHVEHLPGQTMGPRKLYWSDVTCISHVLVVSMLICGIRILLDYIMLDFDY